LKIRIPQRFRDELPPAPPYIPDDDNISSRSESDAAHSPKFRTEQDGYGVFREYLHGKPSITPDLYHTLTNVTDSPYLALDPSSSVPNSRPYHPAAPVQTTKFFEPFPNPSTFRLMTWFYRPSITKSITELNTLVKDVILAPDFNPEDLIGFDATKEHRLMDAYQVKSLDGPTPFSFNDSWLEGSVEIPLPCDGFKFSSEAEAPKFAVKFHYRKIMEVLKAALAEQVAETFHTFPFKAYWKPSPDEFEERIYSEIFTGDFWNAEFERIFYTNRNGDGENSALERFIIGLLIWSDGTALAQFGNAEMWPIYLYVGNQSKYERAKPNSQASHHLAYLPKVTQADAFFLMEHWLTYFRLQLDNRIQDVYKTEFGIPATAAMLTHLKRDLIHAVWKFLMDDDFIHAFVYGYVSKLRDGIERLSFPRFMIYAMDYQEK
jgi:hypothetical protein